ncbi:MAG: nitroreductase family protein [Candidatus Coatesbacteria bacterium]|nr:nitroreductase family protein [Candidatus Coatesbacteria bacterium]
METLECIRTRRSIRKFLDKEVPQDIIREILEAARWAPSGGNKQPWRFVVTQDREKIRTFDPYFHQPWVEQAPAVLVACANPHDTWATYDERDDCFVMDTSAAIQNVLLAAHNLGLGAVWILSFSPKAVRKALGIPPHIRVLSIIPLGYYDRDDETEFAGKKVSNKGSLPRRPAEEIFFIEEYGAPL